jgi:hypothetical protein
VADEWPTLDIERCRQIISSVIHSVVVKRAAKTGGRFDPNRVEVIWREPEH